jgi:hypothetical protein
VKLLGSYTKLILKGNTAFIKISSTMAASYPIITADTAMTDATLTVDNSALVAVGQWVLVQLGQAAYDAGEPDWWLFAKVESIADSTHVTLDRPVCYAMSVASTTNTAHRSIRPITTLMQNVEVNGFDLINPMTGSANAEEGVYAQVAQHIKIDNITGIDPGAGLINLQYVDHCEIPFVEVRKATKQNAQASKGRGLSFA